MAIDDIIDGISVNTGNATNGVGLSIGKGGISLSGNFNQLKKKKSVASKNDSALRDLYKAENFTTYQFPSDIDNERYVRIRSIKRMNEKNGTQKVDTKLTFVFPLPQNLNPNYSVDYNNEPLGALGALASGQRTVGDAKTAMSTLAGVAGNGFSKFSDVLKGERQATEGEKSLALGAGVAAAVTALGGGAGGLLGAAAAGAIGGVPQVISGALSQAGIAFNSHLSVLFSGVGFRSFNFNYRFVPKNQAETDKLREIVKLMKYSMYPNLPSENKFLFQYPDEFLIDFAEPLMPYLYKTKRCVLKNITVNYNGDGVPRFFDNSSPVVVDFGMEFQEVEILTKEDFVEDEIEYPGATY